MLKCTIEQEAEKQAGLPRRLIGMMLQERGVPRPHYSIYSNSQKVGEITSGAISPVLNQGIALGYVETPYAKSSLDLSIEIRGRQLPVVRQKLPFVPSNIKPRKKG